MAATGYRNILISGGLYDDPSRQEGIAKAASTIVPGDLIEWSSGELREHATQDGIAQPAMVAVETISPDNDNTADIDIAYAAADTVYFVYPRPGDVLYMKLASGQNVAKGARLASNGDGTLKAVAAVDATLIAGAQVGAADEAVDATGGVSRIKVRF